MNQQKVLKFVFAFAAFFNSMSLEAAEKSFTVEATTLGIGLHAFRNAHPNVTCSTTMVLGAPAVTCRTPFNSTTVGGVKSSRANFNFGRPTPNGNWIDKDMLMDIEVLFHPAPSAARLKGLLRYLTSEYGKPKKLDGLDGQVLWRWTSEKTWMTLIMPEPEMNEAQLSIELAPSH